MKKFLKRLFLYLIPILLVWAGLEFFYRTVPNNYTFKHQNISKNYDAKVLVFGNSHSFYGLNPEYFCKKTFNISNISQSLYFDELLFNKYTADFKNLKTIVLNVDYFTLSLQDDNVEDQWRKYFYAAQMDLDVPGISIFNPRKYSLALVPRFNLTLESLKKYSANKTLADCNTSGWGRRDGIGEGENNEHMGKIIAQKHEDGSIDFKKNVQRLQDIIARCKSKNIKVLLVTMPVTSYYAHNVDQEKIKAIMYQCNKIADGKHVVYVNLFQDSRFTNSDFYDTDHLNTAGATKCSKIISNLICTPHP
ncbi:D-alanyl-lipoteichoic acid biosynthesis protein DltD [Flavobacterium subsaxonicum]|uniref:SGNH hydrolase-type esterase domain-containing protein n=1 Tax=Flavobacterium subsaxonicum WB 4.1-42 = DSM 21790 TaxID=1121898 RepID=A0A0A2MM58_9FLAO|nr:D-alanyl-lipoteichoic acid biosynthesis protein DltD [Flavobacterium subsaxonicum]KGO92573.1 hypothetical protein Q766_12420 [Flavobacterium subsaxonicum WB 4.1-42 = DSM 21790]